MNKENRSPDKEGDKSQTPTNPQKSKSLVFIVVDSIIKKVDGYQVLWSISI